jgi:T-complex protein 1 subunit gamma
LILSF